MENSNPVGVPSYDDGAFDSRDCVILISDGPSDPIQPMSPERKKWYEKERARLAALGFNLDGTPIQERRGK